MAVNHKLWTYLEGLPLPHYQCCVSSQLALDNIEFGGLTGWRLFNSVLFHPTANIFWPGCLNFLKTNWEEIAVKVIKFYVKICWFKCMHVSGYEQCPSLTRWCKSMINDFSTECPGFESQWLIQTIFVFYFLFFVFKTWSTQNYRELSGYVFYCIIFYNVYVSQQTSMQLIW